MTGQSRRAFLGSASATLLGLAGCNAAVDSPRAGSSPTTTVTPSPTSAPPSPTSAPPSPTGAGDPALRLIGDGSTADTGPQPHQPVPDRLEPGQPPPQFVVFSGDGAANLEPGLFPRFRSLAAEYGAAMTFFLSGIYALPAGNRMQYAPPQH